MSSLIKEYLDLTVQLQAYILQEYPANSRLEVSRESYLDYRQFALTLQQGNKPTPAPIKQTAPSTRVSPKPVTPTAVIPSKPVEKIENPQPKVEVKKSSLVVQEPVKFVPQAITLDVPQTIEKEDFSDIQKIIVAKFPQQTLLAQPPDDQLAIGTKNKWKNGDAKSTLTLLIPAISSHPLHQTFLANVTQAIHHVYQLSCEVVEKKDFQGNSNDAIELLEVDLYLREPHHKRDLWNKIKNLELR